LKRNFAFDKMVGFLANYKCGGLHLLAVTAFCLLFLHCGLIACAPEPEPEPTAEPNIEWAEHKDHSGSEFLNNFLKTGENIPDQDEEFDDSYNHDFGDDSYNQLVNLLKNKYREYAHDEELDNIEDLPTSTDLDKDKLFEIMEEIDHNEDGFVSLEEMKNWITYLRDKIIS